MRDPGRILWEAPRSPAAVLLVLRFGANVSLGNVAPEDILALEALRCGLRGHPQARVAGRSRPRRRGEPDDPGLPRRLRAWASSARSFRAWSAGGRVVLIPLLYYVPRGFGVGALDIKLVAGVTMAQVLAATAVGTAVHGGAGAVHQARWR